MDKDRIVAGLDVHKDTIYLCVMDNTEAVIFAKVYGTLTPDLELMCSEMVSHGVTEAAMESTSTYWVPVWNALCESMSLKLVNPYFIKQLPGRKSDVKDAQWIAECLLKNLIRGSFVPEVTLFKPYLIQIYTFCTFYHRLSLIIRTLRASSESFVLLYLHAPRAVSSTRPRCRQTPSRPRL